MTWNSAADFLAMGGYAVYVWSSFGMCALLFLLEPALIKGRHRAIVRNLHRKVLADREEGITT